MIAAVIPHVGCGNKVPLLLSVADNFDATGTASLLANLNCIAFDFVTRQKIQGRA